MRSSLLLSSLCLLGCAGGLEEPTATATTEALTSDFSDAVVRSERTATGGKAVVWDAELRHELATLEWAQERGVFAATANGRSLPTQMIPNASLQTANEYAYGLWKALPTYGLLETNASQGPAEVDYKRYDYYGTGGVWCGSCYDIIGGYGFCYWPCPKGCEMYDFGWGGC
jgi:hypothetical protein